MAVDRNAGAGHPWQVHAGLVLVQVSFGGFHVAAKAALGSFHPLALAGLRVAVATPLLLILAWFIDRTVPRRADLPWLALLGLLGVFTNQLLFILGLRWTTATNASLLMPSIPVFAAAIAVMAGIEQLHRRRGLGITLAVAGALVTLDPLRFEGGRQMMVGNLLILTNCLSYAAFLVLMRPILRRLPAATVIAWSFLLGGIGVIGVCWPEVSAIEPQAVPAAAWGAVVYIVLIPTTLTYLVNTWAVARSTPTLAATYTTLQPLAAGALAAMLLGERVGLAQLTGGALIVAGLWQVAASGRIRRSSGSGASAPAPEALIQATGRPPAPAAQDAEAPPPYRP